MFGLFRRLAIAAAVLCVAHPASAVEAQTELWDGQRALTHIADLLRFTPRSMGAPGHQQTIDYIKAAMAKSATDAVLTQNFTVKDDDGKPLHLTNIVARFQVQNPRRIIVATHYDSIVKAYRDAKTPDAPMPGANNSASAVALLLETARVLSLSSKPDIGIDMIFFDGEEGPKSLGAGDPTWHPLGSPYFVAHLKDYYPNRRPEKVVDFDMVCDKDLALKPDPSSLASARPEVQKFWTIGRTLAPSAFPLEPTAYPISDDHTAFQEAGIPSFLVIDFDYEPYFNTTQDTIEQCSAASLQTVGRTLLQYLYTP
ncbi:M28 family peptidase [Bradyrhizobium sp. SZCCHNR2023]|uniref:M28 family peptidase n=1 Tax=Bradyrhizobium sp. SZCCHNR2023 TaxID=3057380 RepID=UPI002916ABF0|nr:M28 family peptidase [Bradyrhizobium sp. SZCCHNR2023]